MTDQPNELRQINWSECFAFTQIFKTFRMAIHPGKLGLALGGLVLMALCGVVLDQLSCHSASMPVADEVNAYWQVSNVATYRDQVRKANVERLTAVYEQLGIKPPANLSESFARDADEVVDHAVEALMAKYEQESKDLIVSKIGESEGRGLEEEQARLGRKWKPLLEDIESLRPHGVFTSVLSFETAVLRQMLDAARGLNFMGGAEEVINSRVGHPGVADHFQAGLMGVIPASARLAMGDSLDGQGAAGLRYPTVKTGADGFGVAACMLLMLRGAQWLVLEHLGFCILFLLVSLAIWALFGGAMCRIAALNMARDERISPKVALSFAGKKFLAFFSAPLLPVGMVIGVGILLFLGGLILGIPYVGEIVGGLTFGLSLVGGFVLAMVMIGAIVGLPLMWPTIAVEGSDGFDAVSRSYSYVYSKPWRMVLYSLVALVYGALCYLFVRFFVLILLKVTRLFVGMGAGAFTSRPGTGSTGATKIDAIWPHPGFDSLYSSASPIGMEHWDSAGAFLIGIWVLIVALLLCAFLVSFFFCGSTIIYGLLRREVDATDLEDVYVEEDEEIEAFSSEIGTGDAGAVPESGPEKPSEADSPTDSEGGSSEDLSGDSENGTTN